jgi:anti-sigma B factor antagonist
MNLPHEIFGEVIVVHSPEELDVEQCEGFEANFKELKISNVVLDLDGTESIDSKGLAALHNVQDALRGKLGDLKIATNNPYNRKILELTRLDQQLEVFESVMDAVKSFHQV